MSKAEWVHVVAEEGGPTGATIHYRLADQARVTLEIFDVLGQRVRTLVADCVQNPGCYDLYWDGLDNSGIPVTAGNYLYRIQADAPAEAWKMDVSEEFALGV